MSVIKNLVPRFPLYFPHSNIIYYEMTLALMLEPQKWMKCFVSFLLICKGKHWSESFKFLSHLEVKRDILNFMNRYNILHVPDCKNEFYGFEVLTLKLLKYLLNKIYPKEISKFNLVHSLKNLFELQPKLFLHIWM